MPTDYWALVRENLAKFTDAKRAGQDIEQACKALNLNVHRPLTEETMGKLADHLIAKGSPHSFVGRILKVAWVNDIMQSRGKGPSPRKD